MKREGKGPPPPTPPDICPLCDHTILAGSRSSRHHLKPKLKGGARLGTDQLNQICHRAIHARVSEAEIARRLADTDSLKADPLLAEFLAWVRTKPDGSKLRPARRAWSATGATSVAVDGRGDAPLRGAAFHLRCADWSPVFSERKDAASREKASCTNTSARDPCSAAREPVANGNTVARDAENMLTSCWWGASPISGERR